ncbi:MAG: hypothetical protein IJP54_03390, partial [Synergistaceae bacterium]|nr:hypothetical protein [Synergistaceae bacterium]
MILPNRRFLAFWAMAVVLFAMVTSGGCGSSSSNNFINNPTNPDDPGSDTPITEANARLSGLWRIDTSAQSNFISADLGGTEVSMSIVDYVLRFQSVDIEDDSGELYFDAIAILSTDRVLLPLAVEGMKGDTEHLSESSWSLEGGNTDFFMIISGTESNPSLSILGTMSPFKGIDTLSGLTFKKITAAANMTNADMDSLINGTWQTPIDRPSINGGFIFASGDRPVMSGDMPSADNPISERPAGMPLINGMREIDRIFANYVFEETDTASKSTIITTQKVCATLNASGDLVGGVQPILVKDSKTAMITPLYDKAYKLTFSSLDKAILLLGDDYTTAYMLTSTLEYDEDGGYVDSHMVMTLDKKPDASESTFNIAEQIGSIWSSSGLAVGEIRDSAASEMGTMVEFDFLGLIFPKNAANIAEKSFTANVYAVYHDTRPDASADTQIISLDIPLTYVERIGYDTWYVDDGDDTTEGDNRIIITALNQYVLVTAFLKVNGKEISITAFLSREGDADDIFFSGAWLCLSNDADVHIRNSGYESDAVLLNFGAKFSSVDIDSGTAYVSAVAVLSADLMLIPMVFDNEKASVDAGSTDGEYVVTTRHGTFTVADDPDSNANKMTIQGNISYADSGLTASIEAALTRVTLGIPGQPGVESRQYDFAQVMNGSTWQTTPFASMSGGFAVAAGASSTMMYPAVNSKTFANIVFDGDSTGGTISGFGVVGLKTFDAASRSFVDNGNLIPVTMIKQKVNVSNVFANFYRFEIASGDQGLKGVFVLESETSARMI